MVKNIHLRSRYAFTMIELIFAIVIIAISVMSLPMISQVTSKGMKGNLAQAAIFASIAEINIATTYTWDENSLLDNNITSGVDILSRVINTGAQCTDSGEVDSGSNNIMRRTGHIHRRCLNNLGTGPYSVTAIDCVDSLNASDTNGTWNDTFEGAAVTTSTTGYKIELESKLDVERGDEGISAIAFGAASPINMKEIKVTVRNKSTANEVTVLRTYSANIGEVAYHKRLMP